MARSQVVDNRLHTHRNTACDCASSLNSPENSCCSLLCSQGHLLMAVVNRLWWAGSWPHLHLLTSWRQPLHIHTPNQHFFSFYSHLYFFCLFLKTHVNVLNVHQTVIPTYRCFNIQLLCPWCSVRQKKVDFHGLEMLQLTNSSWTQTWLHCLLSRTNTGHECKQQCGAGDILFYGDSKNNNNNKQYPHSATAGAGHPLFNPCSVFCRGKVSLWCHWIGLSSEKNDLVLLRNFYDGSRLSQSFILWKPTQSNELEVWFWERKKKSFPLPPLHAFLLHGQPPLSTYSISLCVSPCNVLSMEPLVTLIK